MFKNKLLLGFQYTRVLLVFFDKSYNIYLSIFPLFDAKKIYTKKTSRIPRRENMKGEISPIFEIKMKI